MTDHSAGLPRRVHRDTQRVTTAFPFAAVWLGLGAVLAGLWILYFAVFIATKPDKLVFGYVYGLLFVGLGAYLAIQSWRGRQLRHRSRAFDLNGPWQSDRDWNPTEASDEGRWRGIRALLLSLVSAAFLVPFHTLIFFDRGAASFKWIALGFLGLFDLVVLIALGNAVYLILRWLRYREARVRYGQFPLRRGGRVALTFHGGAPLSGLTGIRAELQCIREYAEERGTARQRTMNVVHEVMWESVTEFATDPSGSAQLTFEVPAETRPTNVAEFPPVYWELVVTASVTGVDYEGIFLLPVY